MNITTTKTNLFFISLCQYTLFQNGGDPGWSGSSCTKTRHLGPRNTRGKDRHIAHSGKKAPKQRISLVTYRTSKSQGFSGWWIPSKVPDSPRSKLFLFNIAWSASTVSKSARNHILVINLKLALCFVSGEVEYAYCGPSCTAGKSGFCNHILALMCPLVWLNCLYKQRVKRGEHYVWSRSLGYPS